MKASTLNRIPVAGLICAGTLLLVVALAWAQSPEGRSKKMADRAREGTEIVDRAGYFRTAGDRVIFFTVDGRDRFIVLENLNLERIAQAIADDPEQLQWTVTGSITEFCSDNFLIIHRAVVKE